MPYSMAIYSNEKIEMPKVGQLFIVKSLHDVRDFHWGMCVSIELEPHHIESWWPEEDEDEL